MTEPRLVPVGKVIATHGLRGAVKVLPYGETLIVQKVGEPTYIPQGRDGVPLTLTIQSVRPQGKLLVVQFAELKDISEAEPLVRSEVFLAEESLPATSEGEYYYYQLLGLRVETVEGISLGILRGIIETGSNDVYVIDGQYGEVLIPAIVDVIIHVDLPGGRMIVDPPDGLIDDL